LSSLRIDVIIVYRRRLSTKIGIFLFVNFYLNVNVYVDDDFDDDADDDLVVIRDANRETEK